MIRVFHSNRIEYDGTPPGVENLTLVATVKTDVMTAAVEYTQHPMGGNWWDTNLGIVTPVGMCRSTKSGDVLEHDGKFFLYLEKNKSLPVPFWECDKDYYAPLLVRIRNEREVAEKEAIFKVVKERRDRKSLRMNIEPDTYKMPVASNGFQFTEDIFSKE